MVYNVGTIKHVCSSSNSPLHPGKDQIPHSQGISDSPMPVSRFMGEMLKN